MQAARGASLTSSDSDSSPDDRMPAARRVRLLVLVAALAFVADVVSKVVAVDQLSTRPPISLLGGVLTLRLTRNPGAAFSVGTEATVLLSLVAIAVIIVVVVLARRTRSGLWAVALGLLLGGAAGNVTDRLLRSPGPLRGHVVDFLELPNWPVFNLADSAICVAAVFIVIQSIRGVHLDGTRTGS
ncbi:MAG: signal peptidase II [Actinomycetota bacterium]|nr:signal peptidase II [Actinomycetota bacterium]MDQ3421923.1 signal peptidase II [Actinomycetota bacterium]